MGPIINYNYVSLLCIFTLQVIRFGQLNSLDELVQGTGVAYFKAKSLHFFVVLKKNFGHLQLSNVDHTRYHAVKVPVQIWGKRNWPILQIPGHEGVEGHGGTGWVNITGYLNVTSSLSSIECACSVGNENWLTWDTNYIVTNRIPWCRIGLKFPK